MLLESVENLVDALVVGQGVLLLDGVELVEGDGEGLGARVLGKQVEEEENRREQNRKIRKEGRKGGRNINETKEITSLLLVSSKWREKKKETHANRLSEKINKPLLTITLNKSNTVILCSTQVTKYLPSSSSIPNPLHTASLDFS